MTLIKSISGIRGTIGGPTGDTINPLDIVKFTSAYATFIRKTSKSNKTTEKIEGFSLLQIAASFPDAYI